MTKVEAKRQACLKATLVLQSALDSGWKTDTWYPAAEDERLFLGALDELIKELERRGGE